MLIPNGQNIQFMHSPQPRSTPQAAADPATKEGPARTGKRPADVISKEAAPHLNRHQRREATARLRAEAKKRVKAAVEKEMRKQEKEKNHE